MKAITLKIAYMPQNRTPMFFRTEVSDKDRKRWMGEILLAQPLSGVFFIAFSAIFVCSLAAALYFVEYTRKERVTGQISLDKGLVKVFPQATGMITKRLFKEGDTVEAGQVLFTVSTERSSKLGDTQKVIAQQIALRKLGLETEKSKQVVISFEEEAALKQRAKDIQNELTHLHTELDTYRRKVGLSKTALARSKDLNLQKFVSQADTDNKEQDVLEQSARLQTLERTSLNFQKELNGLQSDIQNAPLRAKNRVSEFDRLIAMLDQEAAETESRRELEVRAPQAGKITAVLAELGQMMSPDKPLLSILPKNSNLQAVLYAPTKAVGFIQPGQKVNLRYEAYPYQKFGQYEGIVKEISRTALQASELQIAPSASREVLYRVVVTLNSPHVMAYGQPAALQEGMQLEADILIDTRKLYEWVLEPLYSLTGKL